MMLFRPNSAGITFLNALPLPALFIFAVVLIAFLILVYRRFSLATPRRLRGILALLRGMVLLLVFWMVLDPYWNRPSDQDWLGVLVDTSKSMSIREQEASQNRLEEVREFFQKSRSWNQLKKEKLREYLSFSSDIENLKSPKNLKAAGNSSRLLTAIQEINIRHQDDPHILGWIAFTDGAATDLPDPPPATLVENSHFPWIFLGMGAQEDVLNIQVLAPLFQEPFFVGDILPVTVQWKSNYPPKTSANLTVRLNNKNFLQKEIMLDQSPFIFDLDVKEPGDYFLDIVMDPLEREGSEADNHVRIALKAYPRQIDVFYAESFYKDKNFFKDALEEDQSFKVQFASSLVGFSRKFQVPFVKDPFLGLPKSREEMLRYDAVVLSDVKKNLISSEQIEWIRELVEEKGGAFLMIGGVDSFGDGGYVGTAIEKMLPVEISEEYKQQVFLKSRGVNESPFRPVIPVEKENHLLLKLSEDPKKNKLLWQSVPLLGGYNYVGRIKPGAEILLQHPVDTSHFGPRVILAVQNFGKGKVLAFTSDITPNWGQWFQEWEDKKEGWLYAKFWRRVLKYLTAEKIRRETSQMTAAHVPMLIEFLSPVTWKIQLPEAWDREEGSLQVKILHDDEIIESEFFKDFVSPDIEWKIANLGPGDYLFEAVYTREDKTTISLEKPFVVNASRVEAAHLKSNHDLLKQLAAETQGIYLPFHQRDQLEGAIAQARKVMLRKRSTPFWSHFSVFLMILGILCLDWFIRKKRGLE